MKKIATILLLVLSFFSINSLAQTTPCNAEFNITYLSNNSIEFIPVFTGTPPAVLHNWSFGDGTSASIISPVHTYLNPGVFTALRIVAAFDSNGLLICSDTSYRVIQIQDSCNLVANFMASTTPTSPFIYHFQNTSTPLNTTDSIRWTFGDGSSSNEVHPDHTYTSAGNYIICLRIQQRNPNGGLTNCISEICDSIFVSNPPACNLVAGFYFFQDTTGTNPFTYHFENTSVPFSTTDSIRWTFGDGSSSNQFSPNHTYTTAGTYIVCLRVQQRNPNGGLTNCIREICDSIVVSNPTTCNLVANFMASTTATSPLIYHFQNTSTPLNTTDSIRWTFGDGSSSNQVHPDHTYTSAGTYIVCLRIQQRDPNGGLTNCIREICDSIVVSNPTTCNLVAGFYFYRDTTVTNPFTYHFENTSVPFSTTDSVRWTFGDGSSSNQFSPNHTYTTAGNYIVCLRIQQRDPNGGLTNCIREICDSVVVSNPTTCNLIASFSFYIDSIVTIPNTYHFVNTSIALNPTDSIRWIFGDGTSSNEVSPLHSYAQPGTYTVCLRVQERDSTGALTNCVSEVCHIVFVLNPPCNLVVNFIASATATSLFTYHFENTSTPLNTTDSIRWIFGDGTSSNAVSPNHTYTAAGNYLVCLRIQQRDPNGGLTNCIRESCDSILVTNVPGCNLIVSFYSFRDTISASPLPYLYHFINTSTPLNTTDSIKWTFGDGTSSNEFNPTHSYAQPGTYTVCLRIQQRNSNGTLSNCIREICQTIVVTADCNIQVHFSWLADSVNPRNVYFTNQTSAPSPAATVLWTFGDGTSSTAWNPVHLYAQPGNYLVCLRVQYSPNCVRTFCDSITVQATPVNCLEQSNFSFGTTNTNSHLFYFTPAHINTTWQYTWTFGDGTGSQSINVSHQFAQPGVYTVCLTVYRGPNCASTTCRQVTVFPQVNCSNVTLSFNYQTDPVIVNKLYFQASSNSSLADQTWIITKLPASTTTPPVILHQNNPAYTFTVPGFYRVCLTAVTTGGCVREYCRVIYIAPITGPGNCAIQPFPNPASSQVNVNITLAQPQMIDVYIYNALNVLVKEKHQPGMTGNNLVTINIYGLVAGTYTMKVVRGGTVCYALFQKL